MKMIKVLHENKMKKRREIMKTRVQQHHKKMKAIEEKRDEKRKELKKTVYRHLGKEEKRKQKFLKD